MRLGDNNEGRSSYIEQFDRDERVFARKRSKEF